MNSVCLTIDPLSYVLHSSVPLTVAPDCADFIQEADDDGKERLYIDCTLGLAKASISIEGIPVYKDSKLCVWEKDGYERRLLMQDIHAFYREVDERHITVEMPDYGQKEIIIDAALLQAFALERHLLRQEALVLHSAFIGWEGKGIAFTAPSGTGKSTQAALWEKHLGAKVINGDRSIVSRCPSDGNYYLSGLPFCGSSGIHHNCTFPLEAIVFIDRASGNRVEEMPPMQAVSRMFGETSINRWDKTSVGTALDLIEQISREVKMVHLYCNMEPNAATTLRHYLQNEKH